MEEEIDPDFVENNGLVLPTPQPLDPAPTPLLPRKLDPKAFETRGAPSYFLSRCAELLMKFFRIASVAVPVTYVISLCASWLLIVVGMPSQPWLTRFSQHVTENLIYVIGAYGIAFVAEWASVGSVRHANLPRLLYVDPDTFSQEFKDMTNRFHRDHDDSVMLHRIFDGGWRLMCPEKLKKKEAFLKVFVIGRNKVGKTTTLQMLGAKGASPHAVQHTEGEVFYIEENMRCKGKQKSKNIIFVDSEGSDSVVKNDERRNSKFVEKFVQFHVQRSADVIILVVPKLSVTDVQPIFNTIQSMRYETARPIFVIHNHEQLQTVADLATQFRELAQHFRAEKGDCHQDIMSFEHVSLGCNVYHYCVGDLHQKDLEDLAARSFLDLKQRLIEQTPHHKGCIYQELENAFCDAARWAYEFEGGDDAKCCIFKEMEKVDWDRERKAAGNSFNTDVELPNVVRISSGCRLLDQRVRSTTLGMMERRGLEIRWGEKPYQVENEIFLDLIISPVLVITKSVSVKLKKTDVTTVVVTYQRLVEIKESDGAKDSERVKAKVEERKIEQKIELPEKEKLAAFRRLHNNCVSWEPFEGVVSSSAGEIASPSDLAAASSTASLGGQNSRNLAAEHTCPFGTVFVLDGKQYLGLNRLRYKVQNDEQTIICPSPYIPAPNTFPNKVPKVGPQLLDSNEVVFAIPVIETPSMTS